MASVDAGPCNFSFFEMITPRISYNDFVRGEHKIVVMGLGYVGLPLAVALARNFDVIGFDINATRVAELQSGFDRTRELTTAQLKAVAPTERLEGRDSPPRLQFASDPAAIRSARLIIVTVPTPINLHRAPDLGPLLKASALIGAHIQPGTTVVYESTVYPGCTEEDCLPVIEKSSGLRWKADFFAGYSPERINPGDRQHTLEHIKKVVAGDDGETADLLQRIYGSIIKAGIFVAVDIKTAEAAKVIENTQRDLNIALMNELALIFDRMGINTHDVLKAAGTKWNFLPFRPGLVGGHCIGVDPYYLTYRAEAAGYHPEVILAGRRINDGMGKYIAEKAVKRLIANDRPVKGAKVLILGITFKENVPDIRNTRVIDIYRELESYGVCLSAFDPEADSIEVQHEFGIQMLPGAPSEGNYDAVILAVNHRELVELYNWEKICRLGGDRPPVVIDVKSCLAEDVSATQSPLYWQL